MFERFTRDARTVVVSTQDLCQSLGTDEVRPVHLLLALTEERSAARSILAAHGITEDAVREALGAPPPARPARSTAPLGDDDAAALRSLGIDLDAIREAVDRQFGEGALDGAQAAEDADHDAGFDPVSDAEPVDDLDNLDGGGVATADPGRRRFGLGGHVRFGRGSRKVLELAVREAIHQRSREIRSEHLALAVLRTDDEGVRLLLRMLGVDTRAVRSDLEGRRSA